MEGRAIARPNLIPLEHYHSEFEGFNGGAGQLPGRTVLIMANEVEEAVASMEGRAIARPNDEQSLLRSWAGIPLQWRAGQLPGRTTWEGDPIPRHILGASMEGRAIARPNPPNGAGGL